MLSARLYWLLKDDPADVLNGIRSLDREMENRYSGHREGFVEKLVSGLSAGLLVTGVVQFHHKLHCHILRIAHHEIEVLALNPIECLLTGTPAQTGLHPDDIRKTHFAKDPELISESWLKHREKRTFRWREKDGFLLEGKRNLSFDESGQEDFDDERNYAEQNQQTDQRIQSVHFFSLLFKLCASLSGTATRR